MINKLVITFFMLATLVSCFKQDTPEINSDRGRTVRDRDQLKACSDITFYEGFLAHKNVTNLFVCTSWDRKFTEMFSALVEIRPEDWNTILGPIDEIFFADRERRDRFIKYYRDLDKDGALDDLGRVITALTDTNFYDGLNQLFICAEDPDQNICKNREKSPTKDEIKDFFDIFNRDPRLLLELSLVIDNFNKAARVDSEKLRSEINKFNNTDFFNSLRVLLVSQAAREYIDGLTNEDIKFLTRFFLTTVDDEKTWVKNWLDSEQVDKQYIYELLSLPVLEQTQIVRDLKVLNGLYRNDVKCNSSELELSIDIKSLVNETLKHISKDEIEVFNDKLLMAVESTKYAEKICPEIVKAQGVVNYWEYSQRRNVNHTLDLSNALTYSMKLLSRDQTTELVKYILSILDEDHDYLVGFLGTEMFNIGNEVNRVVYENAAPFYGVILDILKRSDDQLIKSLAVLSGDLFSEANSKDLYSWAKIWLFWNKDEQNFLFNFIDRHLDVGTDYIRLFEFYSLFSKEVSSSWHILRDGYIKDDEQKELTYQAFKRFSTIFHGETILADYKRFFSRDHILELLRVITSGETYTDSRVTDLNIMIDSDFDQLPRRSFTLSLSDNGDSSVNYICAKAINESSSLNHLILNYPRECSEISSNYALRDITLGINTAFDQYLELFPSESTDHFFEIGGLLSPEMSVWALASAVDLKSNYEANQLSLDYALSFLQKLIKDIGSEGERGIDLMKSGLSLLVSWVDDNNAIDFRNTVFRKLANNKEDFSEVLDNLNEYLDDYNDWVKSYVETVYTEDKNYNCKNFLNTGVGANVCPSDVAVKKNLKSLAKLLVTQYEESEGKPVDYILQASVHNGGVEIPLDHPEAKLKRLTLLETFNYLFDLSDKNLPVNKTLVKHRRFLGDDKKKYTVTTSERIDLVIRNVAFDYNYLGVQYLNAVVKEDDYTDTVIEKKRLMGLCVNAPVVRCGKKMSKDERRRARNAYWAYDGLIDVNNGNDVEPRLKYGKYMQSFLYSLVGSSAKKAQEVTFWPLEKDLLKKHNGRALGYFSEIAAFSNMGRVVHDRVGRTRNSLEEFISKEQFLRVNEYLFANAELSKITDTITEVIETLNVEEDGTTLINETVDWINSLSYNEIRLFEELVSKTLYISTYLGSEKFAFGEGDESKFRENSVYEFLAITSKFVKEHALISKQYPDDYKLKDAISPALTAVSFFYDKLSKEETRKDYWYLFNITYSALKTTLYDIGGDDLLVENIIKKENIEEVVHFVDNSNNYINALERFGFDEVSKNIEILNSGNVENDILWNYVHNSTIKSICPLEGNDCETNPNYDELFKITKTLNSKNNLESTLDWLLIDKKENFIRTSNEFFPYIIFK